MPAYTTTPTRARTQSRPMKVIPCCCLRIKPSRNSLLLNRITDPIPERSVTSIEIKPDSDRLTHQILLRNEPGSLGIALPAAVLAVVAIVAHEEIVTGRHRPLPARDAAPGEHDLVALGSELLEGGRYSGVVPLGLLGPGVHRTRRLRLEHTIHEHLVPLIHPDLVARQTDQALDVVYLGIRRQSEHDHVAALRRTGGDHE